MKRSLPGAAFALSIGVFGFYGLSAANRGEEHKSIETRAEEEVWFCPMHTDLRQNKPGRCPTCGMNLVKLEKISQ